MILTTWGVASSVFRGGGMRPCPPPWKVRKHFLTRYTVKNGISNLYILLKSALKNAGNAVSETQIGPPTIGSSLWPPPH